MATLDLARADPLPRIIDWLGQHAAVTGELGGSGRVGLRNEAPFPRLRITDPPGGDDRDLLWLTSVVLQVEAYGDLDGAPGKGQLRRILYVALAALRELPEAPAPTGGPVITAVRSGMGGGWSPDPSGQPRYVAQVRVFTHPAPQ